MSDAAGLLGRVLKTTAFLVVLWGVLLLAVPLGISILEIQIGAQRFPPQPAVAGPLLLLGTLLTLWSAMTFAVRGRGTPLTIDPPREFVSSGPYGYVRHPFVIGVIAQILALGIALGSVPVIGYAAAALVVWYYVIRPREERALAERFGRTYESYRQQVRIFRPRLTPYKP